MLILVGYSKLEFPYFSVAKKTSHSLGPEVKFCPFLFFIFESQRLFCIHKKYKVIDCI